MDSEARNTRAALASGWFTPLRFSLILGLVLFAVFPRVLLGWDSFFFRDYGVLGYPFVSYHREAFWRGEIPLWNPLSNCGAPFLAQWGTMTLYPFSLIYLLLPLPWSLTLFCFGHLVLGGLGMYFLARGWVHNSFASSVAGVAYVFSGAMFSSLIWPNYQVALGWMPWVVLATERACREGKKCVVIAAVIAAMQMLAGVPEITLFTWAIVGMLWIATVIEGKEASWIMARRIALVAVAVVGLTAAQLLPFLDLLAHSQRDGSFASMRWAMPGWGWANFLVPLFHCFKSHHGPYFQHGQEFLTSYYLGIGLIVLSAFAAWRVRQPKVWVLSALVVLSLILALGDDGRLYAWIRKLFPPIGVARFTVKFVFLAAFAIPLLAAFALARLDQAGRQAGGPPGPRTDGWKSERRSLLIGGILALLLVAFVLWFQCKHPFPYDYWPAVWHNGIMRAVFLAAFITILWLLPKWKGHRTETLAQLGLMVVILADVLTHAPRQNPSTAAANLAPNLWRQHSRQASSPPNGSRVMISPEAEGRLLNSNVRDVTLDYIGKRLALWSNLNLLEGIPKVNGSSTLQLREQAQVQALLYSGTNQFANGLIRFLGVSHRTKPGTVVEWDIATNYLPLISCGQAPRFEDGANALQGLVSPDFDPERIVYLPCASRQQIIATNQTDARLLSQRFNPHRIEIEIDTREPAMVVMAHSFYHAWRARVDGQAASLWRANHAFQALQVPAGRHQVVLVYRDWFFLAGALISSLTLLGGVVYCLRAKSGS